MRRIMPSWIMASLRGSLLHSRDADGGTSPASQRACPERSRTGVLDDPSLGQEFETFGLVAAAHDVQMQPGKGLQCLDPCDQLARLVTVSPDAGQPVIEKGTPREQAHRARAILDARRGDLHGKHHAQGLHQQMAFAPLDIFASILAAHPGLVGRAHALALDHRGRGTHGAPLGLAHGRARPRTAARRRSWMRSMSPARLQRRK